MLEKLRFSRCLPLLALLAVVVVGTATAQDDRPKSPQGSAATQIGEHWIEVSYSRPILRGREDIFGSGEEYGSAVNGGAPVWRVGANVTTRIKTEAALEINGTKVPAGEYSFFIELAEGAWTAILSTQPHMEAWDREKVAQGITWGSYGYSPDHDVVRAPMMLTEVDMSIDQMSIFFADVNDEGGTLAVTWGTQLALLPFRVAG